MTAAIKSRLENIEATRKAKYNWILTVTYKNGRTERRPYSGDFFADLLEKGTAGTGIVDIDDDQHSGFFQAFKNADGTYHAASGKE